MASPSTRRVLAADVTYWNTEIFNKVDTSLADFFSCCISLPTQYVTFIFYTLYFILPHLDTIRVLYRYVLPEVFTSDLLIAGMYLTF